MIFQRSIRENKYIHISAIFHFIKRNLNNKEHNGYSVCAKKTYDILNNISSRRFGEDFCFITDKLSSKILDRYSGSERIVKKREELSFVIIFRVLFNDLKINKISLPEKRYDPITKDKYKNTSPLLAGSINKDDHIPRRENIICHRCHGWGCHWCHGSGFKE